MEQVLPEHPTDISMEESLTLEVGQYAHFGYTLTPADAETRITWLNDNPDVISINNNGWARGLQSGTATISAQTSNGLRAECLVTVPEPLYRFYVWLRNGKIDEYAFEDNPKVTIGEELFTLTANGTSVGYEAADVLKFTLQNANAKEPISGISVIQNNQVKISAHADGIMVANSHPGSAVAVFDMHGRQISSYRIAADGTLNIPLQDYPSGVYIIKTDQSTYKFIKK